MRRKRFNEDACPVARSLDLVGDWWTLLIVKEAMGGVRRFTDFEEKLGIARNILSQRLGQLVDAGILETVTREDTKNDYVLTPKGLELDGVLDALWNWGRKYCFDEVGTAPPESYRPFQRGARSA